MKRALIAGINTYATQKSLRGCLTDAEEMRALLAQTFQYDDVRVLAEAEINKQSLLSAMVECLRPIEGETDGVRTLFFAGHGGRVFDQPGGGEADRIDENLCMSNYVSSNRDTFLLDDDLGRIIETAAATAPFLRIYIVVDACHSGTVTREIDADLTWIDKEREVLEAFGRPLSNMSLDVNDPGLAAFSIARQVKDDPILEEFLRTADAVAVEAIETSSVLGEGEEPTTHLLLAGCKDAQTCKDVALDGGFHGIFTYNLVRLAQANPSATWRTVRDQVESIIAERFSQNPQLEGPTALKDRPIFT